MRILLTGLLLTFFACRTPRYVYAPGQVNAPLLQAKGEFQASAEFGTGPGLDFSAAYSPAKSLGIMINAGWMWDRSESSGKNSYELLSPTRIKYQRRYWDLALGAYTPIAGSRYWSAEWYAGMGQGHLGMDDVGHYFQADSLLPYSRYLSSRIPRFYLQPAIGYQDRHLQWAIFFRCMFTTFRDIKTNYTPEELTYYNLPQPGRGPSLPLFETGMSARFYISRRPLLAIECNLLVVGGSYDHYDIIPVRLSTGLRYRLP